MFMQSLLLGALCAFGVVVLLGPVAIPLLHRLKFGQVVREEGPAAHKAKTGTPTMGGLLILAGICVAVPVIHTTSPAAWLMLFVTLACGALGFVDDYIKVVLKRNLGLRAKEKLLGQILIAVAFSWIITRFLGRGTELWIPGLDVTWNLGFWFHGLVFFIIVGTTNAVNLTDGLDGLAAGTTAVAAGIYAAVSWLRGQPDVAGFFTIVAGAALGFLVFNRHPARIFMGDTGSLALGGALAAGAVLTGTELLLPVIGAVFVAEAVSVILQVASFKTTGRRIFRMSPLHHHFELGGWPEIRVVRVFWAAGIIAGLVGLCIMLGSTGGRLV
ncbi:MAG: phospho-N-acetylmuramoyl-pentapeptide-transferase [Veillonellaceae bacterium]|jgi:phospho-N-acetylmuramoyl-pentapeptide-transferase|nr:phospho-N-acetylmuramoyl-pentapeptide-transferase [Veillonellaceae bacterium]